MTKAVWRRRAARRRQWLQGFRLRAWRSPQACTASLMARLDRLGPAKEVAQIGAAIGREFSHALLAAECKRGRSRNWRPPRSPRSTGLLFREGVPPHPTYLFKHALVQDAAYGTLLREPRRALHVRIAETLESQFAEIAESQPEQPWRVTVPRLG